MVWLKQIKLKQCCSCLMIVLFKRELIDTNAYKLQASLSERVVVDGHGCHTTLHFGVKSRGT